MLSSIFLFIIETDIEQPHVSLLNTGISLPLFCSYLTLFQQQLNLQIDQESDLLFSKPKGEDTIDMNGPHNNTLSHVCSTHFRVFQASVTSYDVDLLF